MELLLLCRALSVLCPLLADDAFPCSQAGRGAEHGEAEASSGSEHPETQPQGAGAAQPARFVTWMVQPSPEAALEAEHPPRVGRAPAAHTVTLAEVPVGGCPLLHGKPDSCLSNSLQVCCLSQASELHQQLEGI